ncbi:hypothetical protein GCM10010521_45410 [Streptomyces rameus]|uniref:Uncharacterized protein n=1 Tax=Streptomyces rameus TaxID=68261 RepID=A0ABP6NLS3_9ACTN
MTWDDTCLAEQTDPDGTTTTWQYAPGTHRPLAQTGHRPSGRAAETSFPAPSPRSYWRGASTHEPRITSAATALHEAVAPGSFSCLGGPGACPRPAERRGAGAVGKSATVLGREIGKTGREMNALLRSYGYLTGEPGAYSLTDKGQKYGTQEDHSRGNARSLHYYRQWTTTTWSDETLPALLNDMANAPTPPEPAESFPDDDVSVAEAEPVGATDRGASGSTGTPVDLGVVAIAAALLVGAKAAQIAAPHARRWWSETAVPATSRVLKRLKRQDPSDNDAET